MFSLVSSKDAFRVIISVVAHYDLELHHIDVKTVFLNGIIEEVLQPERFTENGKNYFVCTLKKSIYGSIKLLVKGILNLMN